MKHFYPGATKRRIRAGANDPQIIPVGVVLHVACSRKRSIFDYFNGPSKGIESHLYLRKDGTFEQYRSFGREADAQFKGNSWIGADDRRYGFISIESQGMGPGTWSEAQLRAIQEFVLWASQEYGFPLRVVTTENPADVTHGGVGYHTMFSDWSNVAGKTCPGARRKKQFDYVIRRWLREQRHPCLHCPQHCPKES